jgi:hypothetical protein
VPRELALRAVVVLALGLAGCAPTTFTLQAPSDPLDFGWRGGEGRQVRVAMPFADERPPVACPSADASKWKRRTQPPRERLRCSDEPLHWFPERLETALREAGYTVVDASAGGEILEIHGTLRTLEIESVSLMNSAIFEADVGVELHVTSPTGLDARRRFYVKAQRSKLVAGAGTLQAMLDESAGRAVRDMTAAIVSLTNRYPAVGVASAAP